MMPRAALYGGYDDALRGKATGTYEEEEIVGYDSRDAVANLYYKACRDPGFTNQPILVVMHGFAEDAAAIAQTTMRRFASRGFLAVAVGMRGRNGADGSPDASGRELGDIVDAVSDARTRYAEFASQTKVYPDGYSGGGGNTYGLMAKFPDFFTGYTVHFGMSDYGADPTYGWWQTNGYDEAIEDMVGGDPSGAPAAYASREHAKAIPYVLAMSGSRKLTVLHDADDGAVNVVHSDRVRDLVADAGLSARMRYLRSESGDDLRYEHGYPEASPDLITAEAQWYRDALTARAWKVPPTGTLYVCGYVETKRFSVRLGQAEEEVDGRSHAVLIDYVDTDEGLTIEVTPQSGDCYLRAGWRGEGSAVVHITGPTTVTVEPA